MGTMTFDEWIKYGIENGYCTEQHCYIHAGPPLTDREYAAWDRGTDFCVHALRLGTPADWDLDLGDE